jgi:hypothetical protein
MSAGYTKTIEALQAKSAEGERRRIAKAIELAMKSGAVCLGEGADERVRVAFSMRGGWGDLRREGAREADQGDCGGREAVGADAALCKSSGDEGHEGRHALVFAGDIMIELAELEDKKGNVRVAMLAATSDVPVGTLLIAFEEAQKR